MFTVSLEALKENKPVSVDVPVWDFEEQLDLLLRDSALFVSKKNLVINKTKPFSPVEESSICGEWYKATCSTYQVCEEDGVFLIPLLFAVDKTGTTQNQRYGLEPLLFTLSIFNKETMENPNAWQPLGLIPCRKTEIGQAARNIASNCISSHDNALFNYHRCLNAILGSLAMYQLETKAWREMLCTGACGKSIWQKTLVIGTQ
ncbi:hypothetical protein ACA910_007661 [Epithemia clementina (nom. ined.)]